MTRSLLRPVRTRRVLRTSTVHCADASPETESLTPGTRKTLAAIGALWVSFAVTASATPSVVSPASTDLPSVAR